MASNQRVVVPEPMSVSRRGSRLSMWAGLLFTCFSAYLFGSVHYAGHKPVPLWPFLAVPVILAAATVAIVLPLELRNNRRERTTRSSWNAKLDNAQGWPFPVVALSESTWRTSVVQSGENSQPPDIPEQPPQQTQIVFMPVGISRPRSIAHIVRADQIFSTGKVTGRDEVMWPQASIDGEGRIRDYGPIALGSGPSFSHYPLLPVPPGLEEEALRWQIAPRPRN